MNKIYTRLINREHPLPEKYIPSGLVDIGLPFDALAGRREASSGGNRRPGRSGTDRKEPTGRPEPVLRFRIPFLCPAGGAFMPEIRT